MIDARTIELVNGAIDGELSETEQAEFDALIENSPQARKYHAELCRLDELLKQMTHEDLPADLHEKITASIELSSPARSPVVRAFPRALGYGIAASVALLIAVGIYQSGLVRGPQDVAQMTGTIAPQAGDTIDGVRFDAPGLAGEARLIERNGLIVLDVMFESDDPVDLAIDLGDSGLAVREALHADDDQGAYSNVGSYSREGSVLRTQGRGRQRFSIALDGPDAGTAAGRVVRLEFSRDGSPMLEDTLTVK
jgi:hypothetical protein